MHYTKRSPKEDTWTCARIDRCCVWRAWIPDSLCSRRKSDLGSECYEECIRSALLRIGFRTSSDSRTPVIQSEDRPCFVWQLRRAPCLALRATHGVARRAKHGGGGGSRTRVPGTFRESIYTFSGFFDVVPGARTHTLTVHPRMWNVGGSPMRRTPALACWRRSAPLAGVRGRTGYKIMQPLEDILLHL